MDYIHPGKQLSSQKLLTVIKYIFIPFLFQVKDGWKKENYPAAVPAVGMAFCRPKGGSGPVRTDVGDKMAEIQDEELKNHWECIILYQFIKLSNVILWKKL